MNFLARSQHSLGLRSRSGLLQKVQARRPVTILAFKDDTSRSTGFNINVHGRHVDVDAKLEAYVKSKMQDTLHKFQGAEFLECEGGIRDVDVRLMNTNAHIKLHPVLTNKELHDTYLRMGELKAEKPGTNVYDSFENALDALEKKLHKWNKAVPHKKDMRMIGGSLGKAHGGRSTQVPASQQMQAGMQPSQNKLASQMVSKSLAPKQAASIMKLAKNQNGNKKP